MKTLGEVLTLTSDFLKERNCSRFRRVAEELLAHVLKLKRLDLYLQFDRPIQETELEQMRTLLKRASKGEPIEYIIGTLTFYQCSLSITKDVLIPRPETEILVDHAVRMLKQESCFGKVAWDVCTGSGCIGIAIKKACPDLTVCLSDLSSAALAVAANNAAANQVDVELLQGDLLAPYAQRRADLFFCNPPYISAKELIDLDPSVKDFEPEGALLSGEDGLFFYQRLKNELPNYLNPEAKIFFEIGFNQGKAIETLFSDKYWKKQRIEKDWAGHDRFFFLEFE